MQSCQVHAYQESRGGSIREVVGAILVGAILVGSIHTYKPTYAEEEVLVGVGADTLELPLLPTPTPKPTLKPNKIVVKKIKPKQKYKYLGTFKLTAYCPCQQCSEGYGRSTASGKWARGSRTVAVDKSIISLGTKLKFGGNTYVAEDVGGGVRGNHIDVFVETHEETTLQKYNREVKVWEKLETD